MQLVRSVFFQIWMYGMMMVIGTLGLPLAIWSREGTYWVIDKYLDLIFPRKRMRSSEFGYHNLVNCLKVLWVSKPKNFGFLVFKVFEWFGKTMLEEFKAVFARDTYNSDCTWWQTTCKCKN